MEVGSKSQARKQSPINYRRIFIVCGVVFALVSLFLIRNVLQSSVLETTVIRYQVEHTTHIKPQFLYNDNKTAFVFGATGVHATTELFKCTSAIESLVKIGGWSGDVYLLIDDTSCLDPKLMASIPNSNIHVVPIIDEWSRRRLHDMPNHNRERSGEVFLRRRRLLNNNNAAAQPIEQSSAIKTHILDYVEPKIELAIWYDCDVIFALPGCVKKMLQTPLAITKDKPFAIAEKYHLGTLAAKQNISNAALVQWREKILTTNGKSKSKSSAEKEPFLEKQVFRELFLRSGENASVADEKAFLSPRVYHDVVISPMIMNSSVVDQTDCVIHLTSNRCQHIPESKIQALIDGFHLESLKDRKWCPSLVRRKFASNGWKWPFCWSPEFTR